MNETPTTRRTLVSEFRRSRGVGVRSVLTAAALAVACTWLVNWIAHQEKWRIAILLSSEHVAGLLSDLHGGYPSRGRIHFPDREP